MSSPVVGVDGWRRGWVAARLCHGRISWTVHPSIAEVLDDVGVVAIDMPIGVVDGPRAADLAAREWLQEHGGPPSSIFLTPSASAVAAYERGLSHTAAMAERGAAPGTSIQAWNLLPKIVELRDALPHAAATVLEAHPECSFRALDRALGVASKKTGLGAGRRLRALRTVYAVDLADAPPDVPVDDLLDAAVLVWTAQRVVDGSAVTLPVGAVEGPRIVI